MKLQQSKTTEEILNDAERLLKELQPNAADELLRSYIEVANEEELRRWKIDIERTIQTFFPKRRKALTELLEARLAPKRKPEPQERKQLVEPTVRPAVDIAALGRDLRETLENLSNNHIFAWSTFYRDSLFPLFGRMLDAHVLHSAPAEVELLVRSEVGAHSTEVFEKGFRYVRETARVTPTQAVQKGLGGLQRFLELPVEFYSTEVRHIADPARARALRWVTSSFLRAILTGFGEVKYFTEKGFSHLPSHPIFWAHYLGFLTEEDCEALVKHMGMSATADAIGRLMLPTLAAIDGLSSRPTEYHPLPVLGQYFRDQNRVEISLLPPPDADAMQNVEIDCFLHQSGLSKWALIEAANRNSSVIITELRPDLETAVKEHERLNQIVVSIDSSVSRMKAAERVRHVLEVDLYKRVSPRAAHMPLTYNFAKDFPLHNPFLTQYFRVRRQSVRNLLRMFERRNGVRLWCSLRRSGKTTACFDLGSTAGGDLVISQTCDSTEQTPGASLFYDMVREVARGEGELPKQFVKDTIESCANQETAQSRCVFVLDEYESLFGFLDACVSERASLRYTLVQPLLNQLVAFSRDNLIVLLGQQPDAHFILMDQNQLSAYVEQDAFPLFTHEPGSKDGEFAELVGKVLTDRVGTDSRFLDALFEESAGHPYLTVKMLVSLVDWLIESGRKVGELRLTTEDFDEFSRLRLTTRKIAQNKEYEFFRQAASEAIGKSGRAKNPWLHAVYMILRQIVLDSPERMSLSYAEVEEFASQMLVEELGFTVDQLLSTGTQANFLTFDGAAVGPGIKLLGRVVAGARGKVR